MWERMPSAPTAGTRPSTAAVSACHLLRRQQGSRSGSCHRVDTSQLEPRSSEVQSGTTGAHLPPASARGGTAWPRRSEGGKKALNRHVAADLPGAPLSKPQTELAFTIALKLFASPQLSGGGTCPPPRAGLRAAGCLPPHIRCWYISSLFPV